MIDNERDLEFIDTMRVAYQNFPVQRAKDVKPASFEVQKKKHGKHLFAHCPGMINYADLGYIIPAWIDMHILANKAGVAHYIGGPNRGDNGYKNARDMNPDFLDGIVETEDGVPPKALLYASPWGIFGNGNISALVMPALYHSTFLDDLYVVPGIVDYEKFHTVNFICMPKRRCEVHIKAGDPLLHVIPFWNKDMRAGYGPGEDYQVDSHNVQIKTEEAQYYRKYMALKKKFDLEKIEE